MSQLFFKFSSWILFLLFSDRTTTTSESTLTGTVAYRQCSSLTCSESSAKRNSATCVSQFYRSNSNSRVTNTARERHAIPPARHSESWCHWRSFWFKFHLKNCQLKHDQRNNNNNNPFVRRKTYRGCIFVFFIGRKTRRRIILKERRKITSLCWFHSLITAHTIKVWNVVYGPVGSLFTFYHRKLRKYEDLSEFHRNFNQVFK